MTQCPGRDHLESFLENGLKGTDRDELERHVETCAACQETLEALTDGTELGSWRACALDGSIAAAGPALDLDRNECNDGGRARSSPIANGSGSSIGRYKLAEKIGEGGMGVVYLAEQSFERLRRASGFDRGEQGNGAVATRQGGASRARLDRDEGARQVPVAAVRNGERAGPRRRARSCRRPRGGWPADGGLSLGEVRAKASGRTGNCGWVCGPAHWCHRTLDLAGIPGHPGRASGREPARRSD